MTRGRGQKMRNEKILVVDDDPLVAETLCRILQMNGFYAFSAEGGAEGLRKTTDEHPDLVILDVLMPDVNGYEVLLKIKERAIPTRVIILTGVATSMRDVVKFIKAGACDFLTKDNWGDLVVAVKRALAMETTLNLHVSDTTPIVEQLIAKAEKLVQEKNRLEQQNRALSDQRYKIDLIMIAIRLLCLLIAIGLTALLYLVGFLSSAWAFFIPVILFVLLLLPIERVKRLRVKAPTTETDIEM